METIGVTLGDPAGIGPEIVAATIARLSEPARRRLRVFGDRWLLEGVDPRVRIDDAGALAPGSVTPGVPDRATGAAQVRYLESAIAAAAAGELSAIVTAPIHKPSAKLGGLEGIGHTELLAARLAGGGPVAMMFAGPRFRAALATVHVPLRQVPEVLTADRIVEVCALGAESMRRDFGIERPRIGVLGLNPHAGEDGLLGTEEREVIEPAIERCRAELDGVELAGPLVPDVGFRGSYDLWVAMYHDQALIPLKLDGFDETVNVTLGLPIVRTSPDHGVAHDIAGEGVARPDSMMRALELAIEMVERRA